MFKPSSNNIVFFDSEFSSNDPNRGEILSLALLKLSGDELYLELEYSGEVSDWVKDNILPTLTQNKISKNEARQKIKTFLEGDKPYLVTYVNQFDFVYLCKLINYQDLPVNSIPIDFASILFGLGIDPNDFKQKNGFKLMKDLKIDVNKYNLHHALDDVKLLKEVYLKLQQKFGPVA